MINGNLRVFFALQPLETVAHKLWALSPPLTQGRRLPWQTLHVTLAFIGEVDQGQCDQLAALGDSLSGRAFELSFEQLRYQPGRGVLSVVPHQAPFALQALERQLRRRLSEQGFRTDTRAFRPHVSLARRARLDDIPVTVTPVIWSVDGFCLMASHMSAQGSRYEVLRRWTLAAA